MSNTPYLVAAMKRTKETLVSKILTQLGDAVNEDARDRLLEKRNLIQRIDVLLQVVERPGAELRHVEHEARFLAFILLADTRLPEDMASLPARMADLKWLGFDMVSLSARSVFEEPITGEDFR